MRRSQVILAAILVLGWRLAAAAPSIGVVVVGEPALQGKVRSQIGAWITQHGYALASKSLSADAQKTLTNCFVIEDTGCARGVYANQVKADYLVYVRVDLAASAKAKLRTADLAGYWFAKDRDPAGDKRACNPCTNAALNQAVNDLMGALFEATALAKARLRIGTPPGLVVMLDGNNVGVTPIEEDVPPGPHRVALVREGKELGASSIEAKAGDITDVVVPIKSEPPPLPPPDHHDDHVIDHHDQPPPPPPPPVQQPSRILPGLLIVTGLGAVAVGGVFVYYGQKNGVNDPVIYPNATKQGVIIAGAGGVVLVTGLVWWWARGSSSSNGPTASIGSGGTIIGWEGRF